MLYQDITNGKGIPDSIATAGAGPTYSVSFNTTYIRGELSYLHIEAASSDTVFDVKITDRYGLVNRHYQKETGIIRDEDKIGLMGKYTVTIENATKAEAFKVLLKVQEIHS